MAKHPDLRLLERPIVVPINAEAKEYHREMALAAEMGVLKDLFEQFPNIEPEDAKEWMEDVVNSCHKVAQLTPEFGDD